MKTNERRPMLFTRISPEELQEAQEVADEKYDGNLSMLVRLSVRAFVRAAKRAHESHKEAA